MSTPLGANIVKGAGMDDPSKWTINKDGDTVAEFVDGYFHLVIGDPISQGYITQVGGLVSVIGKTYQVEYQVTVLGGYFRWAFGTGAVLQAKSGRFKQVITATAVESLTLGRQVINTEYFLDWFSIREVGVAMSKLVMEFRDWDGDKRQTSMELGVVSDGTTYTTVSGEAATLAAALAAVSAGNVSRQQFVATDTEPDDTNADSFLAQAHNRWIIEYLDATTGDGPYQIDIPCPDLGDDTLVLAGSTHYDPDNAEWQAVIAAMEGEVKNPRTGNDITIVDIFLEE